VSGVTSLRITAEGNPVCMRRVNGWPTIFWVAMVPLFLATGWVESVVYVSALLLWVLVSAWQATRIEVDQHGETDVKLSPSGSA
jgi:membrane protein required for beta-lactamase induction